MMLEEKQTEKCTLDKLKNWSGRLSKQEGENKKIIIACRKKFHVKLGKTDIAHQNMVKASIAM
jgi:hypothetical protein